ncbi:MAG TPA: SEC-C domain-containing protein [Polyangiaceae bacterium]|nr:SEC-C domain-containing protein [Polyangiaceae bacterium]
MKASRNDPCPCGSGKKYKRCHLESDQTLAREQPSPRVVERADAQFMVSGGLSDDDIGAAADYFENRERSGGWAQQMIEFVQPLLDKSDGSKEQVEKAVSFGMLCWNIAIMPRAERAVAIDAAEREIAKTDEDREAFRDLVELMLARYEELFS